MTATAAQPIHVGAIPVESVVCPSWCTVTQAEHLSDLPNMEGRGIHWSAEVIGDNWSVRHADMTYSNGEPDPNDRECCSEFHAVPLPLHMHVDRGTPGDRWGYDTLDVLMRRANAGEVEVVLLHEAGCPQCDSDREVRLTLDEARAMRDQLDELIRLAAA